MEVKFKKFLQKSNLLMIRDHLITKMGIKSVKEMQNTLNWGITKYDVNKKLKELKHLFKLTSNQIKQLEQIITGTVKKLFRIQVEKNYN